MSGRGSRASLPPAGHAAPQVLTGNGLVVHHYNRLGLVRDYDFSTLPVAEPIQRSLGALFAGRCVPHRWSAHATSMGFWYSLVAFSRFLCTLEQPPATLEEVTVTHIRRWQLAASRRKYADVANLLRGHEYFQAGLAADELAKSLPARATKVQSFTQSDFDRLKAVARRDFRAALLRIRANAAHLERWRAGDFAEDSRDFVVGEGLDIVARTGDLPRVSNGPAGQVIMKRYRVAMGGVGPERTWARLFLTSQEAIALGVLLMAAFGWNLSVIDAAAVPLALPDQGEYGRPVYRIPVEKYRRGPRLHFETRNVADNTAASQGRLITEALEATRFARTLVEELAPGTDRLLVWRSELRPSPKRTRTDLDRLAPIGPFCFGFTSGQATSWARRRGFDGSPFLRGRRTALVIDKREPAQHSQDTHDRSYALVDRQVQDSAAGTIAAGAQAAVDGARKAVLAAQLVKAPHPGDVPTAIADCEDMDSGPFPTRGGSCAASFLMCLGCTNAHIHPGHHPRLAYLHAALTELRSVLTPAVWNADWSDAHARLEDVRTRVGAASWSAALARISTADSQMISLLLNGDLDS